MAFAGSRKRAGGSAGAAPGGDAAAGAGLGRRAASSAKREAANDRISASSAALAGCVPWAAKITRVSSEPLRVPPGLSGSSAPDWNGFSRSNQA